MYVGERIRSDQKAAASIRRNEAISDGALIVLNLWRYIYGVEVIANLYVLEHHIRLIVRPLIVLEVLKTPEHFASVIGKGWPYLDDSLAYRCVWIAVRHALNLGKIDVAEVEGPRLLKWYEVS
jgi:hypothetical protein